MSEEVEGQKAVRGRPRSRSADTRILKAALKLVEAGGFQSVTMEAIAATADVARTTIYRRWRNKESVIMDAFLEEVGPTIAFPALPNARESVRLQMKLLAKAFRGKAGLLIRSLLAEAQFNPELQTAFRERWIAKRRASAIAVIKAGIVSGELPSRIDPDILLDVLYGGLYYRLLIGTGAISDDYVDSVWDTVIGGLGEQ
jgi:AcrR family transcriptional regulator